MPDVLANVDPAAFRPITADMTDAEWDLYRAGPSAWGTALDRATRGAAFLDRVMPGWEHEVSVKELDLGSPCRCVLGQIFMSTVEHLENLDSPVYDQITDALHTTDVSDGFNFGLAYIPVLSAGQDYDRDENKYPVNCMFGFDHTEGVNYVELTDAWCELISARTGAPCHIETKETCNA